MQNSFVKTTRTHQKKTHKQKCPISNITRHKQYHTWGKNGQSFAKAWGIWRYHSSVQSFEEFPSLRPAAPCTLQPRTQLYCRMGHLEHCLDPGLPNRFFSLPFWFAKHLAFFLLFHSNILLWKGCYKDECKLSAKYLEILGKTIGKIQHITMTKVTDSLASSRDHTDNFHWTWWLYPPSPSINMNQSFIYSCNSNGLLHETCPEEGLRQLRWQYLGGAVSQPSLELNWKPTHLLCIVCDTTTKTTNKTQCFTRHRKDLGERKALSKPFSS